MKISVVSENTGLFYRLLVFEGYSFIIFFISTVLSFCNLTK